MSANRVEITASISFDQALLAIRNHIAAGEPGDFAPDDADQLEEYARNIRALLAAPGGVSARQQMLKHCAEEFNCPPIAQQMKDKEAAVREAINAHRPKSTPDEVYRRVIAVIESPWPDPLNDERKRELHDAIKSGKATSARVMNGLGLSPVMFPPEAHQRLHYCLKQLHAELQ